MKRISLIIAACIIPILFFCAGIFLITTSGWFLWYNLPQESNIKFVIDLALLQRLKNVSNTLLSHENVTTSDLSVFIPFSTQYAVSMGGEENKDIRLIIRPKLGKKNELYFQLEEKGWTVVDKKIFLIAQKSQHTGDLAADYALSRLGKNFFHAVGGIAQGKSFYPLAIVYLKSGSLLSIEEDIFFTATKADTGVKIGGTYGNGGNEKPSVSIGDIGQSNTIYSVYLRIPGQALDLIPISLKDVINKQLSHALGFDHTSPDFITLLEGVNSVEVRQTNEGASITIDAPDRKKIGDAVQTFIEQNDAHNYPEKHAFLLPDRTLAYEYIPGDSPVQWEQYNRCELYKGKNKQFYLCKDTVNTNLITISNQEQLLQNGNMPVNSSDWSLFLQGISKNIQSIEAYGREKEFVLYIK